MEGRCEKCGSSLPITTGWDGNGSFIHEFGKCQKCKLKKVEMNIYGDKVRLKDIKSNVIAAARKQCAGEDHDVAVETITAVLLENGWVIQRKETVYNHGEGIYSAGWEILHRQDKVSPVNFIESAEGMGYLQLEQGIVTTESIFAGL